MGHAHAPTPHARIHHRQAAWIVAAVMVALVAATVVAVVRDHGAVQLHGSGTTVVEARHVPAFSGVDLAGANVVIVHAGQPRSVVVHADRNLLSHVTTEVHNGRLVVGTRGSFSNASPMHVEVGVPVLRAAVLSGAGTLSVDGVRAGRLTTNLSGAGVLRVSGTAGRVDAFLTGGGTVALQDLRARDVYALIDGGGTMYVRATRLLDASVRGAGTIAYAGHPATVTRTITGAGAVVGR